MSRKLNWDKAKWDSIKSNFVPTGEDIDPREETQLQTWWDANREAIRSQDKKPESARKRPKPKKKKGPKFPKGTSVLVTEVWGMVLAKEKRRADAWAAATKTGRNKSRKQKKKRLGARKIRTGIPVP